jgi:hypothetical protein
VDSAADTKSGVKLSPEDKRILEKIHVPSDVDTSAGRRELFCAYVIKGAVKIEGGATDFALWSAQMVRDYGNDVQPHLGAIHAESAKLVGEMRNSGAIPNALAERSSSLDPRKDNCPSMQLGRSGAALHGSVNPEGQQDNHRILKTRRMNSYQLGAIWIATIMLVLNCLFPPWVQTFQAPGMTRATKPAGYAPIFDPPSPEKKDELFGVGIDVARFLIQSACITMLAGALVMSLRSTSRSGIKPQ